MDFLELLKVVFLGIVQGITEWLPISSTGHMILVDEFFTLKGTGIFKETFFVLIQLGSVLAVVFLFWNKIWPFGIGKNTYGKSSLLIKKDIMSLWGKVLVATVPAIIIGLPLNDFIDSFYNYQVVSAMLIIYGILFIIIENRNKKIAPKFNKFSEVSYKTAAFIGIFQVLSLVPGTSRSGATILGAMLIGASRFIAAEFSFFMSIPVMFGASVLKLVKSGFAFSTPELVILILGMVVAFLVSVFAIKYLMKFIKTHDFKPFGYYRIVLGIVVIAYFLIFR